MNKELFEDMFYAAPELWYIILLFVFAVVATAVASTIQMLKLRRENYFIKRDKERYAETLYACKDGYFAFVYGDDGEILEHCSRRLAIIFNLPQGIKSGLKDLLKHFYKDDVEKLQKYIGLLKEDGVSFEDNFSIKDGRTLALNGVQITDADGTHYSDIIWVRDISNNSEQANRLLREKEVIASNLHNLEDLVDNLPYPVWLRNHSLNLVTVNKKYVEFAGQPDKETVIIGNIEIGAFSDETKPKEVAREARDTNSVQKKSAYLNRRGTRYCFDIVETPFLADGSLDRIATAGALIDVSELDNLKRNLKQYQNSHLEILGTLGTAFVVYDNNHNLDFYNPAFVKMWNLDENWLEQYRTYANFLDILREKRLLPEVPDYPYYKNEELKAFDSLVETGEDLLHLPDGRSFRRLRAPHPKGGLIFAFEDVSDRLTARREYNSILSVQQEILNNLEEAVLIFASNGRLKFYNQAYVSLWDADEIMLRKEPALSEVVETYRGFFAITEDWDALKKGIIGHILNNNTKTFALKRADRSEVECFSVLLSNESVMVLMKNTESI